MKKIFIAAAICTLLAGCATINEEQALSVYKSNIEKKLPTGASGIQHVVKFDLEGQRRTFKVDFVPVD